MFSTSVHRLEGIEDLFKGGISLGIGTVLPLYTQYQNLVLLKKQQEAQKQLQQIVTQPPFIPSIQSRPATGQINLASDIPWGLLVLGGGAIIGGYFLLSGGKRKN